MFIRQFPTLDQFKQLASSYNVVPVCKEILADMETPVSLLTKLYRQQGPVFLLESVEGGEKWGRYSFLSTSSRAAVKVFRHHVEISDNGNVETIEHHGDPLTVLKTILDRYQAAEIPELPRFWGGLVGYISYEMVSFFERIPNTLPDDAPIAHFIIPDTLLIFDNIRNTLMCLALGFIGDSDNANQVYADAENRLATLLNQIETPLTAPAHSTMDSDTTFRSTIEEEDFCRQVAKVKDHIQCGDIIQCVISQPFYCPAPSDPIALYRAQRYINPSPYLFFMHLGETVLAGSSPETMVRLENRVATLRPIAGTRPRGGR